MFQKMKAKIAEHKNKIAAVAAGAVTSVGGALTALAEGEPTDTWTAPITTIFNTMSSAYTPAKVASILAIALTACVGLVFFWFGARKIVKMVSSALKKGKISI